MKRIILRNRRGVIERIDWPKIADTVRNKDVNPIPYFAMCRMLIECGVLQEKCAGNCKLNHPTTRVDFHLQNGTALFFRRMEFATLFAEAFFGPEDSHWEIRMYGPEYTALEARRIYLRKPINPSESSMCHT